MRADRLVAIVLLLQVHGRLSAADLAERLETSERTVRRDLEALGMAGVPVYSQRGRGGGWQLLGGHRIDLSGLTAGEAQALFVATAPGASGWLAPGAAQALGAARRKVLAALPAPLRSQVVAAGDVVLVDPLGWGPAGAEAGATGSGRAARAGPGSSHAAHLDELRHAVLEGRQVAMDYEPPGRPVEERRVHPYGLVCKQGVWYLVAGAPAGLRTYRVSRVRSVTLTADSAARPEGFDLAQAWAGVLGEMNGRARATLAVEVALSPWGRRRLEATVGAWWPVEDVGPAADGRARALVRFPDARVAAAELVALGDALEVLSPPSARAEVAALGRRLVDRHRDPEGPASRWAFRAERAEPGGPSMGPMIERCPFGRTGHRSSRVVFGSAGIGHVDQKTADTLLPLLDEYGVNHLDTAADYGDAELRLAPWLAGRRGDFFVATKTSERTAQGARASLERSLTRLGVDQVDLIQLHNLVEEHEWEIAHGPGGALEAMVEARAQGLVRFIGVTGHGVRIPRMHLRSLARFPYDSVLFPYNHPLMANPRYRADVEELLALCASGGVAVQTIKAIARRRWADRGSPDARRAHSWYEPLRDPAAIGRAVRYVLGRPELFLASTSEFEVLPALLAAAAPGAPPPTETEMQQDDRTWAMAPLFDGGALERI